MYESYYAKPGADRNDPLTNSGVTFQAFAFERARERFPNIAFRCESAEQMSFLDATFDIAFESTLFMMLTSEDVARRIAGEMLRVTRSGGYLMIADWRYARPGSEEHRAMTRRRIAALFDVGGATRVVARERGALVPPLGRFLSSRLPPLYFVVQGLLPFYGGACDDRVAEAVDQLVPTRR